MSRHVLVLMGGWSAEREVSLVSGRACAQALREAGYRVSEHDLGRDLRRLLDALQPPGEPAVDVIFNALHGPIGEDGCVQGVLEIIGIPYTHSGVLASALAIDKPMAKQVFRAAGLRCPEGQVADIATLRRGDPMPRPFVVKPVNEGSSVGVHIVRDGDNADFSAESRWSYGARVLVERYIPGRELTVGVMEDRALPVTELKPKARFYDYEAKYTDGLAEHVVPARIPGPVALEAQRMAVAAHRALGCRGVSRADFRWDDSRSGTEGLYLLEVNTQPGMTPLSLVPEQARHEGMSFPELVTWMVERALCLR